jgi:uncharacterized protein
MLSRILLSLLLVIAGIVHLWRPEVFNPAIPFPWKWEINLLSGVFEIILGCALWIPKSKDLAARLSALWFLLLTPVHVFVCVKGIPMFGTSSPFVLWGRLFLQPALYFWALSLQERGWIMSQRWSQVAFLHFEVDQKKLQELVPFQLDLFEGKAILSIVPFIMSRIRFPFLPPVPGFSTLLELNLRTYVKQNGRSAVYFFTLDSNHLPGVFIARLFFALPYRWVKLRFKKKSEYEFSSPDFELKAKVGDVLKANDFNRWATERYALFTKRGRSQLCGVVEHEPWTLQELQILSIRDDFSSMIGRELKAKSFLATAYAQQLDVRFRPFRKIDKHA